MTKTKDRQAARQEAKILHHLEATHRLANEVFVALTHIRARKIDLGVAGKRLEEALEHLRPGIRKHLDYMCRQDPPIDLSVPILKPMAKASPRRLAA